MSILQKLCLMKGQKLPVQAERLVEVHYWQVWEGQNPIFQGGRGLHVLSSDSRVHRILVPRTANAQGFQDVDTSGQESQVKTAPSAHGQVSDPTRTRFQVLWSRFAAFDSTVCSNTGRTPLDIARVLDTKDSFQGLY